MSNEKKIVFDEETTAALNDMFLTQVNIAISAFWRDAYPTLAKMVYELIPQAMYYERIMEQNPGIDMDKLLVAAMEVKQGDPELSYKAATEAALERISRDEPQ